MLSSLRGAQALNLHFRGVWSLMLPKSLTCSILDLLSTHIKIITSLRHATAAAAATATTAATTTTTTTTATTATTTTTAAATTTTAAAATTTTATATATAAATTTTATVEWVNVFIVLAHPGFPRLNGH